MAKIEILDISKDPILRQQMFMALMERIPKHVKTLRRLYENGGDNQINTLCLANSEIAGGTIGGHLTSEVSYWNFIFVEPEYRRQGTGRKLMQDFESRVQGAGRTRIECEIEDAQVLRWFMEHGYRIADMCVKDSQDPRIKIRLQRQHQLSVYKNL